MVNLSQIWNIHLTAVILSSVIDMVFYKQKIPPTIGNDHNKKQILYYALWVE